MLTGWGWEEEGEAAVEEEAVEAPSSLTGSPASGARQLHREQAFRKELKQATERNTFFPCRGKHITSLKIKVFVLRQS